LLPDYGISNAVFSTVDSTITFTVEDYNEPLNDYSYSQKVPIKVFDSNDNLLLDTEAWINGTSECSFQIEGTPDRIQLDYSEYTIVQLAYAEDVHYDYTDISLDFGTDVIFIGVSVFVVAIVVLVPLRSLRKRGHI
jgi:hypothetical protein